jgi:hypothetical protein
MDLSEVLMVAEVVARWVTVNVVIALVFFAVLRVQFALIRRNYGLWLLSPVLRSLLLAGYFVLGLSLDPLILVGFWALIGLPIVGAKLWRAIRWSIEEIGYIREARVA